MQVAPQLADVVDPDLVAERLEHVQVGVRTPGDAVVVAEQLGREEEREVALADAGRAVQEIGVRRPLAQRGRQEALRLVLLRDGLEVVHALAPSRGAIARQISVAISSTSRSAPSGVEAGTTSQPSRCANSR